MIPPTNDGGPAFPNVWEDNPSQGMSLRDWHAGLAMQGAIASENPKRYWQLTPVELARQSYAIADAMLAERGG